MMTWEYIFLHYFDADMCFDHYSMLRNTSWIHFWFGLKQISLHHSLAGVITSSYCHSLCIMESWIRKAGSKFGIQHGTLSMAMSVVCVSW